MTPTNALPATGRALAFSALKAFDLTGTFLATTLDESRNISPADRGLAMELSYGVLRRRDTIDAVLRHVVDRPRASVEPDLWTILRLGVYQILLVPGFAEHAAIHETVELARQIGMPRWTGLINGVLRTVQRLVLKDESTGADASSIPLVAVEPPGAGESDARMTITWRRLSRPVLPNPVDSPIDYAAEAFSMPRWLIERWGPLPQEEIIRRAAWFSKSGLMALRVNPLRVGQAAFLKTLASDGIDAQPGMFPESIRIRGSARIDTLTGFEEGWFSVQDESAMAVTNLLAPQAGENILDLCAAPGGKTTHMAERMRDEGRIIACDVSDGRLRQIRESADRLGVDIVETWKITTDGDNIPDGPFDAVAVDAPCSNTGVIGKRPEVRWRLRSEDLVELPGIQGMLLRAAADRVRPGGRLVYSTCSIDPAENGGIVSAFLESQPDFTLDREQPAIPGQPGDGGYAALLRRR